MNELFRIASSASTPLALSGFFAAAVFLILRQIIAKNIFPKLTSSLGAEVIVLVINRIFVLALVAMILGSVGYALTRLAPAAAGKANNRGEALDLDAIHSNRTNISDICVFHMVSLSPSPEHDGIKPLKLGAYINRQRISFPVNSPDFESAPKPYSAKVEIPCSDVYSVAFSWTLKWPDGHEGTAGENTFHIVSPGQVVRYGIPWFESMTFEIGYSARP